MCQIQKAVNGVRTNQGMKCRHILPFTYETDFVLISHSQTLTHRTCVALAFEKLASRNMVKALSGFCHIHWCKTRKRIACNSLAMAGQGKLQRQTNHVGPRFFLSQLR